MGKGAAKKTLATSANAGRINQSGLIIIILLVSFAVYYNTLFNGFVWDDLTAISADKLQKGVNNFSAIADIWGQSSSNYYRPMIGITYTIAYSVFGLQSWGFHLLNILFHAGVSVFAFLIIARLLKEHAPAYANPGFPAFLAALFFAAHPLHAESVAWVSGITDPSFSFFYLLSFYLYVRSTADTEELHKGTYLFSLGSFFIATLYKEPAVTLPAVLMTYDYAFRRTSVSRFVDFMKRQIPYLLVAGVYLLLRLHALSGFATGPVRHSELSAPGHFINVFPLFMNYLYKLVLPLNLSAFYVLHPISSILEPKGIISLIVIAAFVFATVAAMKKNRAVFFGLVLIIVPLLPALYIRATGPGSFAERYLYLSVLGLAILLALSIVRADITMPRQAMTVTVVIAVLIGFCSAGTVFRNSVWKDDYTLWTDTVVKSPDGAVPHHNLGNALLAAGQTDEAIEQYKTVLAMSPDDYDTHNNLGAAYGKKGLLQEALKEFQASVRLRPDVSATHSNLGNAYRVTGSMDKAIEECSIALKLNPNDAYAHNDLGLALAKKGHLNRAVEHLEEAARLNPDDPALRSDLAQVNDLRKNRQ